VAALAQALDDLVADEPGTTDDDDFHGKPPFCVGARGA
jgi:hypothetical protein